MEKMTNIAMFNSVQTLTQVEERGILGYACARNLRKLLDALKEYMEKRDELLKTYGTPKGNSQYLFEGPDAEQKFLEELRPYNTIEHDVDIYKVPLKEFLGGNLTSKQMYILEWMIDESEEAK